MKKKDPARLAYLASKPKCWCGRVSVDPDDSYICRADHYSDPGEYPPCMCYWRQTCGGSGMIDCRGCGGDNCICTCGGELECDGCEDCSDLDFERDEIDEDEPMPQFGGDI